MKTKRGFIRIIEAVIAVIIVFGYIVTVLPKDEADTGRIPPELDNTLQAILKEIQTNPDFRNDVIFKHEYLPMRDLIDASLPPFTPWKYAFKMCKAGGSANDCMFYAKDDPRDDFESEVVFSTSGPGTLDQVNNQVVSNYDLFTNRILFNTGTATYTKSAFLSEGDITAPGFPDPDCNLNSLPPIGAGGDDGCTNLVITFYMWSTL